MVTKLAGGERDHVRVAVPCPAASDNLGRQGGVIGGPVADHDDAAYAGRADGGGGGMGRRTRLLDRRANGVRLGGDLGGDPPDDQAPLLSRRPTGAQPRAQAVVASRCRSMQRRLTS